jgi:predicted acetylornithine/succinylornithine family transaminase
MQGASSGDGFQGTGSFLTPNYNRLPVAFVRGQGCWLYDGAGREYLDAFAGVAVNALGHGHSRLSEALARQCATLLHVSNHFQIPEQERVAALINSAGFAGRAIFGNSGTEANEAAYKVARLWGNSVHGKTKTRMIAFQGSFHGRTLGALSITWPAQYRTAFEPLADAEFLPYGDELSLARAMGADVAAVFVEPIQGEGGVNVPPDGFLSCVRRLCDQHESLMVCDEIQTGIGRTGHAFGFQHDGAVPDVITLAKGLGGGVPIGAAVFGPRCSELLTRGLHGSTFGGNPLACTAATVVLEELLASGGSLLSHVRERGAQLEAGLRRIFPASANVRGRGLLWGATLSYDPRRLILNCLERGLVVGPASNNTLRLAPPLTITENEVTQLLERLGAAAASQGV